VLTLAVAVAADRLMVDRNEALTIGLLRISLLEVRPNLASASAAGRSFNR